MSATEEFVSALRQPSSPAIASVKTLTFIQNSFVGGLNQFQDSTRIGANEYYLLINGRNRYDTIKPIANIKAVPDVPRAGIKYQGLYAAGSFQLLFVDGKAFYKNVATSGYFQQVFMADGVTPFQMNGSAERIYAELVPASTVNFTRVPVAASKASAAINLTTAINGSVQCVVCQDGTNQPWVIFNDGTARVTRTYELWENTISGREYVPIGTIMAYIDGILYVVNGSEILRSVTGRPLDFVVNITSPDGDKGGNASTVSHRVSYENITSIESLNAPDGSFYVGTVNNSYAVTPNVSFTLFGEPTFSTVPLFNTGALNNFCIADIDGDFAFVDYNGIRSFNAVLQFRYEGQNAPFSKRISKLFGGTVIQTNPVTVAFDDYILFSVLTKFGQGVVVYDTLLKSFAGLDIFPEIQNTTIKQFCAVKTPTTRRLYFITADNRMFEYYGDTANLATTKIYIGEWCSGEPKIEQKPQELKLVFIDTKANGNISIVTFVDGKTSTVGTIPVKASNVNFDGFPINGTFDVDTVKNTSLSLDDAQQCWKVGFLISWNFDTSLSQIRCESTKEAAANSDEQQAALYQ